MDNHFKFDNFDNAVWNNRLLTNLAKLIHESDKSVFDKLFFNNLFTRNIRLYLGSVLNMSNETILKVYWEEFKTFRETFKESYSNAINSKLSKKLNIEENILNLLNKRNIPIEDTDNVIDRIDRFINKTRNKVDMECKICYDKVSTQMLVHDNHACTICISCTDKFDVGTQCPFCRLTIKNKLKIIIN
uniref:RING-type domain-containing protein n=1 Tax=Pyramimonas orientalis virus TaxID=455367 RepID=A0A7L9AYY7_POV01|nr:hypothetical protein HWQ62_00365 [Pyramimonas orientalis virus]